MPNLHSDFISNWKKIKADTTLSSPQNQPNILAWVSPLEEHLLHYLPFPVKKVVQPHHYNPLNFKERFVNDSGLLALNNEVWHRLAGKKQTILILGGWSDSITSYEVTDHQFLLTKYIQRLLFTSLRHLPFEHLQFLEVVIIGPVPKWGAKNLKNAPEFSLSLARRLALNVMAGVSWTYHNPCGLMEEVKTLNRKTSTKPFLLCNSDQIISKPFATLLEVSFANLICCLILGNKPDDSWQSKLKQDPRPPKPSDIYDCQLDKQGLCPRQHGLDTISAPTTLPSSARHGHQPLRPPSQLGKRHDHEDNQPRSTDTSRMDHLHVVQSRQTLRDPGPHRNPTTEPPRTLYRTHRPWPPLLTTSFTVSKSSADLPRNLQPERTSRSNLRKRREDSPSSSNKTVRFKSPESSNKTKYRERRSTARSVPPESRRHKYPRYDTYNPLPSLQGSGNSSKTPISRSQQVHDSTYSNGKSGRPSSSQRTKDSSFHERYSSQTYDRDRRRHENRRDRFTSQWPFDETKPLNYDHLSRYTSNSDDDNVDVPPMLSSTLSRPTNKLFLASLLLFTIAATPAATVKIDRSLLCRPRISPDNLNGFIETLSESLNLILDTDIGHPDQIMKTGRKSIIIVKPNQNEDAYDLDLKCDQLGSLYSPNSISEFDKLCRNIKTQVPFPNSNLTASL